ncbi:DPCD protein family [Novymonas esmeraldas]|uniref:Protein DPCD n=1 Tax=Novymonas esmeraldas TaxID=1808958 RepID=A0AAW0EY35_9TRYP
MLAEPKSSVIRGDRKQITSKFTDGSEVVEEYDVVTDALLLRKRRSPNALGGFSDWLVEVGTEVSSRNLDRALLVESSGSPVVVRQDTKDSYVVRIRNLPYPKDVFSVAVERQDGDVVGKIVVRTSNKKYFKRLDIPDLERARIPLESANLSYDLQHQTLILQYKKPLSVLTTEAAARKERASMPSKRADDNADCKQQ